jgi:hypothetical protein
VAISSIGLDNRGTESYVRDAQPHAIRGQSLAPASIANSAKIRPGTRRNALNRGEQPMNRRIPGSEAAKKADANSASGSRCREAEGHRAIEVEVRALGRT